MSIAQIHDYLALCQEGDATLSVRREIIKRQEEVTLRQIDALQQQLETIKKKVAYYDALLAQNNQST